MSFLFLAHFSWMMGFKLTQSPHNNAGLGKGQKGSRVKNDTALPTLTEDASCKMLSDGFCTDRR